MEIRTFNTTLPLNLGKVNSYLISTVWGHVLIDTGSANQRASVEKELLGAGCQPGKLLILITHGDFDHTGNAAFLRKKFDAKIAMHASDAAMLEDGNMFANRKRNNRFLSWLASRMFGFGKAEQCSPDILVEDGWSLQEYACQAKVIAIPGHSSGSIGILTAEGDLFCGDLLENLKKPAFNSIMDDPLTAHTSLKKLRELGVRMVYPGHGGAFLLSDLML